MSTAVTSTALLTRLRDSRVDESAWRDFSARYEPIVRTCAQRAGLQDADIHDVVQETLLTFVERFRAGDYDPQRGKLRAWLREIAANKVREAGRRHPRREVQVQDGSSEIQLLHRVPDEGELEDVFEAEWERAVLADALRDAASRCEPQTFEAFRLYALEDRPVAEVATQLGMSSNAVYIAKNRVLGYLQTFQAAAAESW